MIRYKKENLFKCPQESILVHSCNAQGVWGAGIALEFKRRFPDAYRLYVEYCLGHSGENLRGSVYLIGTTNGYIACLFTSDKFGTQVDSPKMIIDSTRKCLKNFRYLYNQDDDLNWRRIHSPKINSGNFKVPWEQTEQLIVESGLEWNVWDLR